MLVSVAYLLGGVNGTQFLVEPSGLNQPKAHKGLVVPGVVILHGTDPTYETVRYKKALWPDSYSDYLMACGSDHSPMLIRVKPDINLGNPSNISECGRATPSFCKLLRMRGGHHLI